MSNLLKFNSIMVKNDDKLVIDSNRMIEELLAEREKINFAKKAAEPDEDGFVCGLDAATVEELVTEPEIDVEQQERLDMLIESANAEAEQIIADARQEAEHIKKLAEDQGYKLGLSKGEAAAQTTLEERMASLENDYMLRHNQLEEEYAELRDRMEPELCDALADVFSQVIKAYGRDKKDMVLALVNSVMNNVEMSREFTIKVSEKDYPYLYSNKDKIYGAATPEFHIEIMKDIKLEPTQCIIETDAGVFDCSLDVQLDNLVESIKLLSCMHN